MAVDTTNLFAALLPALTALIGAWAGAKAGLYKQRRERAFERQLSWYEKLHAFMKDTLNKLIVAIDYERAGADWSLRAAAWEAVTASEHAFGEISVDAELYAPNKSIAVIRNVHEKLALADSILDAAEQRTLPPETLEALVDSAQTLRKAIIIVAADVRGHLGLERLDIKLLHADRVPPMREVEDL